MEREAVGQQNAECVKFITDFRKWFIITSDTECTEEVVIKPRGSVRESEEAEGEQQNDAQVNKRTCLNQEHVSDP